MKKKNKKPVSMVFFFFAFEPRFLVISTRKKPKKNTSQTKDSISEVNTVGVTV